MDCRDCSGTTTSNTSSFRTLHGPPNTYSIAENAHQADVRTGAILNSIDPNLRPFEQHGGKLIQYVGWGDTAISPENDINYYNSVAHELGGHDHIRDFYRLFMVPGMAHCGGGPAQMRSVRGSTGQIPPIPRMISSRHSTGGSNSAMRLTRS